MKRISKLSNFPLAQLVVEFWEASDKARNCSLEDYRKACDHVNLAQKRIDTVLYFRDAIPNIYG